MSQPVNCDVTAIVCQLQFNLAEETLCNVIIAIDGERMCVREREREKVLAGSSLYEEICDVFHLSLNTFIF